MNNFVLPHWLSKRLNFQFTERALSLHYYEGQTACIFKKKITLGKLRLTKIDQKQSRNIKV